VPFTAVILEIGSLITGTIHEQPVDGKLAGQVLNATLDGEHLADTVRFQKTYDPGQGMHAKAIRYEGLLTPDATEIEGRWTLPGNWSGKFLMIRSGAGLASAEAKQPIAVPTP
jgi:hypothetical protein